MSAPLFVAVLVSAGRHPVSGVPRACRGDAVAMAIGHSLTESALRVLHAGAEDEPSLNDYMAYGAKNIEVVPVREGDDAVAALASVLRGADVILTGCKAEQGAGSGLLPYLLAEALSRPVIANALEVKIERKDSSFDARIRQFLPKGQRRQIACATPLVIAVHPFAPVSLKYAYARQISGQIEVIPLTNPTCGAPQPDWVLEKAARTRVRLKAQEKKSGHARLLSAIVSEVKGGVVAFEGTTVDKAQVVLNYLREHRLVDF